MRRIASFAAVAALMLSFTSFAVRASGVAAAADDKAPKNVTNIHCPVMGLDGYVDPTIRIEYKGQYVYFCCQGCVKMFEKDPEKYIANLPKEEQEAIKPNENCPVMDEKITSWDIKGEYAGKLVYFCCPPCKKSYEKKLTASAAPAAPVN